MQLERDQRPVFHSDAFPPPLLDTAPSLPIDRCIFGLGVTSPQFQLRMPSFLLDTTAGGVRYSVELACEFNGQTLTPTRDVPWVDVAELETSSGGRPDDVSDLVGICDMTCPTADSE